MLGRVQRWLLRLAGLLGISLVGVVVYALTTGTSLTIALPLLQIFVFTIADALCIRAVRSIYFD